MPVLPKFLPAFLLKALLFFKTLCFVAIASENLNYTYLFFENGYPTRYDDRRDEADANVFAQNNPNLVVQTGYYSLRLDCDDMALTGYDALAGSDYITALHEDVTTFTPATGLELKVTVDGVSYTCKGGIVQFFDEVTDEDSQYVRLIQSNRFVKRFDHLGLIFESDVDGTILDLEREVRFEVTAWADRATFKLDFEGAPDAPAADLTRSIEQVSVKITSPNGVVHEQVEAGESAILCIQPHLDTTLNDWDPNQFVTSAYNKTNNDALNVEFDSAEKAIHIDIPSVEVNYPSDNDRVDEFVIELTNPTDETQNLPLIFDQPTPCDITGTVMILCEDEDGRPTGIPVQISKNWHKTTDNRTQHDRGDNGWLRGYSMVKLRPGETRTLRLRVVFGFWADAAAISHSQLSLIGWTRNWKWDETALGAWGESFTYDPTMHAGGAFMDDVRPTFTDSYRDEDEDGEGDSYDWTENLGGGDFLIYRDSTDTYHWLKGIKTAYKWAGPNITEVLYSGVTDDDKIRVTYKVRAVRTNDYHRRFHSYRYEFLEDVISPDRFVFHQMAADEYKQSIHNEFFIGGADGVEISELDALSTYAGNNEYVGNSIPFNNKWLSISDQLWEEVEDSDGNEVLDANGDPILEDIATARRGIISLSSTLNGEDLPLHIHPYAIESDDDQHILFDFATDRTNESFEAGDIVEGEVEFIMTPKSGDLYWGLDTEFSNRLSSYGANYTWEPTYDEFRHNAKTFVDIHEGKLVTHYPVHIESFTNDEVVADFTITSGGIGHVPVIISGVDAWKAPKLQRYSGGTWVDLELVDIADNEYYQGYLNSEGTMDYAFNLKRPSTNLTEPWRVRVITDEVTEDPALTIYYVRHGEGGHNVAGDYEDSTVPTDQWPDYVGHSDQFTYKGDAQVSTVAAKLDGIDFEFVASSPLWRARNTVLPNLITNGTTGVIWPKLAETYISSDVLDPTQPTYEEALALAGLTSMDDIYGQGGLVEIPADESAYFSVDSDQPREFDIPDFNDRAYEVAIAKKVQQDLIIDIENQFGGSGNTLLFCGHSSSGRGFMRVLTNKLWNEDPTDLDNPENTGVWVAKQLPSGEWDLIIQNDRAISSYYSGETTVELDDLRGDLSDGVINNLDINDENVFITKRQDGNDWVYSICYKNQNFDYIGGNNDALAWDIRVKAFTGSSEAFVAGTRDLGDSVQLHTIDRYFGISENDNEYLQPNQTVQFIIENIALKSDAATVEFNGITKLKGTAGDYLLGQDASEEETITLSSTVDINLTPVETLTVTNIGNDNLRIYDLQCEFTIKSNTGPVFSIDAEFEDGFENVAYTYDAGQYASDANGNNTLSYSINGPAWLTIDSAGVVSGTPTSADIGTNSFLIKTIDDHGVTDNMVLTVEVRKDADTGYFPWAADHTSSAVGLSDDGVLSDPDHDGIDNLLEYMLAGPPNTPNNDILPTMTQTSDESIFSFNRLASSVYDTNQIFEYSSDLENWSELPLTGDSMPANASITDAGSGIETIEIIIDKNAADGEVDGKFFGRIKVVENDNFGPDDGIPVIHLDQEEKLGKNMNRGFSTMRSLSSIVLFLRRLSFIT